MNIGTDIRTARTTSEALEIAQLNWKVKTTPTMYKRTTKPLLRGLATREKTVESEKYVAILREDTQEEFAHVTKRYQLVQNQQAFGMVTMVAAIPALAFLALAGIPASVGLKALAKGVEAMGKGKVMMGAVVVGVLSLSMLALGGAAMLFASGGAAGTMLMVVAMYALVGALALMGGCGS